MLNSFQELCIMRVAAVNTFARVLNPNGGAYIYVCVCVCVCLCWRVNKFTVLIKTCMLYATRRVMFIVLVKAHDDPSLGEGCFSHKANILKKCMALTILPQVMFLEKTATQKLLRFLLKTYRDLALINLDCCSDINFIILGHHLCTHIHLYFNLKKKLKV